MTFQFPLNNLRVQEAGGTKLDKKDSLVPLDRGAFGKVGLRKVCFWKRVLLDMDELEKGALGNGCFWKRVLL